MLTRLRFIFPIEFINCRQELPFKNMCTNAHSHTPELPLWVADSSGPTETTYFQSITRSFIVQYFFGKVKFIVFVISNPSFVLLLRSTITALLNQIRIGSLVPSMASQVALTGSQQDVVMTDAPVVSSPQRCATSEHGGSVITIERPIIMLLKVIQASDE